MAHFWPTYTFLDGDPPDWSADDPAVQVFRTREGVACAYGSRSGDVHWLHLPSFGSFRFGPDGDVGAIPKGTVSRDFADAYRRVVLPLVMQARGWEVLHASGVATSAGVVAFCGVSGTGKSTTATGLGARGYPLWADDVVPVQVEGGRAQALTVPFRMRLLPDAVSHFEGEPIGGTAKESFEAVTAPLAAIFLLERTAEGTNVERVASVEAFTELLIHAYFFSPEDSPRNRLMIGHYLELVATVPIFRARFSPGLATLRETLDAFEEALSLLRPAAPADLVVNQ